VLQSISRVDQVLEQQSAFVQAARLCASFSRVKFLLHWRGQKSTSVANRRGNQKAEHVEVIVTYWQIGVSKIYTAFLLDKTPPHFQAISFYLESQRLPQNIAHFLLVPKSIRREDTPSTRQGTGFCFVPFLSLKLFRRDIQLGRYLPLGLVLLEFGVPSHLGVWSQSTGVA
jgi:hypothetical protein